MAKKQAALIALALAVTLAAGGCGVQAPQASPTPEAAAAPKPVPEPVSVSSETGRAVIRQEGEAYFPSRENWTYHFVYAYPRLLGEDYVAAAINDTYQMALDEMVQLVLPMFATEEDMRFDGKNEVSHDFYVTCNNSRFLSIVQTRRQTMGAEGETLSMEPLVFDVSGEFSGETLTLRGCVLAGITDKKVDEMTAEEFPQAARLIAGSSDLIAEAVARKLYPEFVRLQESGAGRQDVAEEDFEWEFSPAGHFYMDEEGRAVFFFPPSLFAQPTFDVPAFPFTAEELEALL